MTLEDFFTLTEMKDGLSTLGRVEELVSLMQKQRECVLNNVGDAARQWSTVAGTLAATANKECLNHFVQLNGLCFLNQWLQEAQKCNEVVGDNTLEGFIIVLLATLERLPIGMEKSTVSGIGVTVEHLLGHENLNIKEKAKNLSSKWNNVKINDVSNNDLENGGTSLNDEPKSSVDADRTEDSVCSLYPVPGIPPVKGATCEASCKVESQHSNVTRCSESSQADVTKDIKISVSDQLIRTTSTNSGGADAILGDMKSLGSSLVSKSCPENLSVTEVSSVSPAVGYGSADICSSPVCMVRDADDHRDVSVHKEVLDGAEGMEEANTKEGKTCKSSEQETSDSSGLSASSPSQKAAMDTPCNFGSEGGESCISKAREPQPKSVGVVHVTDDREPSYQRKEAVGSVSDIREPGGDADMMVSRVVDTVIPNDSSIATRPKAVGQMDQKSELGVESEEIDALEVARQVALEVEREVVDYREPFCSSPEVNSGETKGICSPEGKQDQSVVEELDGNLSPNRKHLSDDAMSPKEQKSRITESIDADPGEPEQVSESAKVTPIDHGSAGKFDKSRCDFDLNEDVCAEEYDCPMDPISNIPVNLSAPIAVVAASKGAPNMPVTPLHFEGEMGWKGSAATSAFRPASPRRTPDCEKTYSSPKRKSDFLEFDLNVAESDLDVEVDPTSMKQMPISSGLPSGDSSVEISSKTAERLNLDLNRLGDDDTSTNPTTHWRLYHHTADQNMSSASSSSSRQPSVRDFDLNDNPCLLDADSSHDLEKSSSKASATYGSPRRNDPVIRIMGSRTAVERNNYVNQAHQSFYGNGLNMEAMMAGRPAQPYAQMPPHYGYNGQSVGATMPIPPAFYGPGRVPYMMDSRGTTVVPQVLGSAGLNDAASSMNGVGPSRFSLDLNSGMASMESSGSRVGGSFQEMFVHGHNGSAERMRIFSQPSSSGMASKRKEPDSGWEPYAPG